MLVRNEEVTLRAAVESVSGLADEILIGVDTASTDGTLALARAVGTRVIPIDFMGEHGGSFAAALNHLCDQANGEWILRLDGHEYLDDHGRERLTQVFVEGRLTTYQGIALRLRLSETEGGVEAMTIRLFRPGPGVCFVNPIHETIAGLGDAVMGLADVVVHHHRPASSVHARSQQRQHHDRRLLKQMRAENPSEAGTWAHLGRLAIDRGVGEEGRALLERALELGASKKGVFRCRCHLDIGWSAHRDGDQVEARAHAHGALLEHWNVPEAHCLLADCALTEGDQERAWHHLSCARSIPSIPLELPVHRRYHTWWPAQQLARLSLTRQQLDLARAFFSEVCRHEAPQEALEEARPWCSQPRPAQSAP